MTFVHEGVFDIRHRAFSIRQFQRTRKERQRWRITGNMYMSASLCDAIIVVTRRRRSIQQVSNQVSRELFSSFPFFIILCRNYCRCERRCEKRRCITYCQSSFSSSCFPNFEGDATSGSVFRLSRRRRSTPDADGTRREFVRNKLHIRDYSFIQKPAPKVKVPSETHSRSLRYSSLSSRSNRVSLHVCVCVYFCP